MGDFLKAECPHCGQSIEYPSHGTGESVPCPTCEKPFVLTPLQPRPRVVVPESKPVEEPKPANVAELARPINPRARPESLTLRPPPLPQPMATVAAKVSPTPNLPPPVPVPAEKSLVARPESAPAPALLSTPSAPAPAPKISPTVSLPPPRPAQTPPTAPTPPPPVVPPPRPAPLEQAFAEFASDPVFGTRPPTREQVARAWSFARFKKEDDTHFPEHAEVVGALKKLFPEFRTSKPAVTRSHGEK